MMPAQEQVVEVHATPGVIVAWAGVMVVVASVVLALWQGSLASETRAQVWQLERENVELREKVKFLEGQLHAVNGLFEAVGARRLDAMKKGVGGP